MATFWAGDRDSYALVLQAEAKVEALLADNGMKAGWREEIVASLPSLWHHEGSTAVVKIHGGLVKGEAGLMRLFGVVGYDDIARAAVEAASHADTQTMMYSIESPGGDVDGMADISATLNQISSIKPSAVYTGSQMCSGGYWLASSLKNAPISAGPVSQIGSIGVLRVHSERSKQLEEEGVKVTVLRSGKYKAEINAVEELTPEIKARAEAQLTDIHSMFRSQVAKGRPNLDSAQLAEVTEGQVFLGKRAVQAGLADQVQSFDQALKLLDKRKQSRNTSSNSTKGKAMQLTPEQLTAIAAGAPLASFGIKDDGTAMSAEEITAYDAKVAADSAAAVSALQAADAALAAKVDDAAPAKADDAVIGAQVTLLKEQLAAAQTQITTMTVAAAANSAKLNAFDALVTIARDHVGNMLVGMGGSKVTVEGMDAAAVVAEHTRVKPLFLTKFTAGRKSVDVNVDNNKEKSKDVLPAGFLAALKNTSSANR